MPEQADTITTSGMARRPRRSRTGSREWPFEYLTGGAFHASGGKPGSPRKVMAPQLRCIMARFPRRHFSIDRPGCRRAQVCSGSRFTPPPEPSIPPGKPFRSRASSPAAPRSRRKARTLRIRRRRRGARTSQRLARNGEPARKRGLDGSRAATRHGKDRALRIVRPRIGLMRTSRGDRRCLERAHPCAARRPLVAGEIQLRGDATLRRSSPRPVRSNPPRVRTANWGKSLRMFGASRNLMSTPKRRAAGKRCSRRKSRTCGRRPARGARDAEPSR